VLLLKAVRRLSRKPAQGAMVFRTGFHKEYAAGIDFPEVNMFRLHLSKRAICLATLSCFLGSIIGPALAEEEKNRLDNMPASGAKCPYNPKAHHFPSLIRLRRERNKEGPPKENHEQPAASDTHRPTVGLALGGGGTRGAAHIGVLKVFEEEGIPIDCITGTSMGAIVGGLYSADVPINTIEEQLADARIMRAFMTVPLWVRFVAAPVLLVPRMVGFHPYDGLYWGGTFRKHLAKLMPNSEREIEELGIPFTAVAVDITDGKRYSISKGSLAYALQASSAVPVLRKPVQIGNHLYCDGGVIANVPVKETKAMGPDIVIAVDVDERVNKLPLADFRKVGSVSKRMIVMQLAEIDAPEISKADILIHPMVDGIGLISTKKSDARKAIKAGEEAARQAIPAIRAKLGLTGQPSLSVSQETH
jgi:predicted acylesterase/phospholipase RssA